MDASASRSTATAETRERILEVARDVLGGQPDAGMGDIAAAAGVVRRTVYGHFPSRAALVRTLAERAARDIVEVISEVKASDEPAADLWTEFVRRLWPVAHRYRVLLALRRGELGEEIHALLTPVDQSLAELVERGQRSEVFARHLPPQLLGQLAYAAVFTVADAGRTQPDLDVDTAVVASLLLLGVPEQHARDLSTRRRSSPSSSLRS
ncbi:TetR/AcrR family transcriptional regulator [Nocardioides acrostichi]|uniref:TetR/AcrR family transcriptional regulator n=1 Tax=Nocardioides acrostichi TaxID=2784339 RepID=A0A930UZ94_9ACTN|nr:TetR/AcrR family transcriptional regulator [Nocardioides acrostichi]MBF4163638.1 TetR/AcrR family transcriptional regulator [Nocardioides acrostichi]